MSPSKLFFFTLLAALAVMYSECFTSRISQPVAFIPASTEFYTPFSLTSSSRVKRVLSMASTSVPLKPPKKGYEPKWKKKATLAEAEGKKADFAEIGLKGTIPVVFKQGNSTKMTVARPGQLVRDVATQAGQFIKYGCGKGECGTCEALCNGEWIRPCSCYVPDLAPGEEYVIQVKQVKSKAISGGKFYSVRSFFVGFWNNLLGMIGMVLYRKAAKKSWDDRRAYEEMIKQKTLEKKLARLQQQPKPGGSLQP